MLKEIDVKPPQGKIIPMLGKNNTRKFTQAYKLRILELGARCKNVAELESLLKREKLHNAQLTRWWKEFSDHVSLKRTLSKPLLPQQTGSHLMSENVRRVDRRAPVHNEMIINPLEIMAKLWRRKWLLLSTVIITLLLAITFVSSVTPEYTSRALVMIGSRHPDLTVKGLLPDLQVDVGTMQNELEVLRSYSIAEKVIEKLDLDQYPEFNPALRKQSSLSLFLEKLKPADDELQSDLLTKKQQYIVIPPERVLVIEEFLRRLKLAVVGESRVIELKFTSHDSVLAADIANAVLEIYLNEQIEQKFSATNKTSDWLNKRVEELRQKVKAAETAVEEFRKSSGLLETTTGTTLYTQQLTELNLQLILAGTERAEKETRLRQAQGLTGSNVESATEVMGSELIRRLREQETVLEGRMAELSTSYGSKHPKIVTLAAEKQEIQSAITQEIRKIIAGLRNEANIARIREDKLKSRLRELEQRLAGSNEQEVQLRALEREAEANRNLLATFLSRYKETSAQTDLEDQQPDAKVISYATATRKPSFPKTGPILGLALFGSLLLGFISVFIRELFDRGYRSSIQIEKETRLSCLGLIPKLGKLRSHISKPEVYIQKYPASPLSESIRSMFTGMHFNKTVAIPPKVVQFTSTYPGEGKSTIARSLAILKRQAGLKTIIIDADLRNPGLHKIFKTNPKPGLAEYLSGKVALHQVIKKHKSGVYLITAGQSTKSPTDLLPSGKMDQMISDLSEVFDLIIIDSPPVLAVPDARILSSKVDMTVFVVKWADTRREVVRYALKLLSDAGAENITTLLSLVDAKKHAQYSYADSGIYIGNLRQYYAGE